MHVDYSGFLYFVLSSIPRILACNLLIMNNTVVGEFCQAVWPMSKGCVRATFVLLSLSDPWSLGLGFRPRRLARRAPRPAIIAPLFRLYTP